MRGNLTDSGLDWFGMFLMSFSLHPLLFFFSILSSLYPSYLSSPVEKSIFLQSASLSAQGAAVLRRVVNNASLFPFILPKEGALTNTLSEVGLLNQPGRSCCYSFCWGAR